MDRVDTFFNFLKTAGWGQSGIPDIGCLASDVIVNSETAQVIYKMFCTNHTRILPEHDGHLVYNVGLASRRALLCGTQIMAVLGCVVASLDSKGKC